MKENFLTIPDAPNYEINSQLVCRNKRTGKVLKLHVVPKRRIYYSLRPPGWKHTLKRSPKTLRRQTVEVAKPKLKFEPIPSLGGRYEIDTRGVVRNTATKQVLKRKGHGHCVEVHFGEGKYVMRAVVDLLWEVHGIIKPRRFRPAPCYAENIRGKRFFPHLKACARFLAPKCNRAVRTIYCYLCERRSLIGEWKITYVDQNPAEVDWNMHDLGTLARRQQKLEATP